MRIAVISTSTYAAPPLFYGGEIFFWHLARGFCEMGHEVTLYGAPGSRPPHDSCRCKLRYIPGSFGLVGWNQEYAVPLWYYDEIVAHDLVLDCAHMHLIAENAYWYHRKDSEKIIIVPNGVSSVQPRCGPYNVVVGSVKWKDLMVYGRSQFHGTPFAHEMGESIDPIPEENFLGVVPWATDAYFYTPGPPAEIEDYFLFLGRTTAYKGLGMALDLAVQTGIRLMIVPALHHPGHKADWEQHLPLVREATEQGANIEIRYLPMTSKHHQVKRQLYQHARALLFPVQCHEPFGLTVIEALCCGTPAITSNLGAMPEIIRNEGIFKNGFLCRDLETMATAVKEVEDLDRDAIRLDAPSRWHYRGAAGEYLLLAERKLGISGASIVVPPDAQT